MDVFESKQILLSVGTAPRKNALRSAVYCKYTFETRDLSVIQILSSAVGASFGPKIEISSPILMLLLSNLSRSYALIE